MTASTRSLELAQIAAKAASDKLGENIVALDVSEVFPLADIFVFASSRNDRQTPAIADEIADQTMPDVEIARPFPRLEIAPVLRASRRRVEVFGGLIARVAECVRQAIAVALAQALLERQVVAAEEAEHVQLASCQWLVDQRRGGLLAQPSLHLGDPRLPQARHHVARQKIGRAHV